MNVASAPPRPNTKLGRKIVYSSPDAIVSCSIAHLAPKYGTTSFVVTVVPSALIRTNRSTPASFAAAITFVRAARHHALEVVRLALEDRDEVHDVRAAVDRRARGSPDR